MSESVKPGLKKNSVDPTGEFAMNVPDQLFYLLFQIVRHRDARFDTALLPLGLTIARWRALAVIRRIEACSMKDLSRYSAVDRTTLTRSVDHLVAEGLVDRQVPANDRRMVVLNLTEAGEVLYDKAVRLLLDLNRSLLRGVSPDAARDMTRAMETILANLLDPDNVQPIVKFGRAS